MIFFLVEGSQVSNRDELKIAAQLLGVTPEELEKTLCNRTVTRGAVGVSQRGVSMYLSPLKPDLVLYLSFFRSPLSPSFSVFISLFLVFFITTSYKSFFSFVCRLSFSRLLTLVMLWQNTFTVAYLITLLSESMRICMIPNQNLTLEFSISTVSKFFK